MALSPSRDIEDEDRGMVTSLIHLQNTDKKVIFVVIIR